MNYRVSLVFLTNFLHLIAAQIFLRRLQIILPVDLTAWTLILCLQFGLSIILVGLLPRLELLIAPTRLIAVLLSVKIITLLVAATLAEYSLGAAVGYFAVVSAEIALIFRFVSAAGDSQNLARVNLFINLGAAIGLYFAEKIAFRMLPLQPILIFIAGAQIIVWQLWLNRIKAVQPVALTREDGVTSGSSLAMAKFDSAFAGFLLFAGLLIAHRILRIYLMDAADIIAEINVFSMIAGAFVSQMYPQLGRLPNSILRVVHLISVLIFLVLLQHADYLLHLPREFLLLLCLVPLVVVTTSTYLGALTAIRAAKNLPGAVAANLVGSLVGALLFGYFLIPNLGIEKSVTTFAMIVLAWLVFRLQSCFRVISLQMVLAGASVAAVILLGWHFVGNHWLDRQLQVMVENVGPSEKIVAKTETPQDIWLLTEKVADNRVVHHRLIRNSHSMSGSLYPSRRYMKLMAYLGFIYTAQPKAALNIGYGTGLTAQALTELALEKIDVSDVSSEIVTLASLLHQRENRPNPVRDTRVKYHLGGARHFLSNTDQKYDIITGEPPPPSNSSIAYLYTKEFYAMVREHLNPGGVFTYWLPTHSVADGSNEAIWETFCSAFVYCDLYAGTESNLVMVGYISPARIPLDARLKDLEQTRMALDTGLSHPSDVFSLLVKSRSTGSQTAVNATVLITDDRAYIQEDFPSNKKRFWGLSGIPFPQQAKILDAVLGQRFLTELDLKATLRPVLIYSADSVFDPFRGLRTLEALQPRGVSAELATWLLGIDPGLLEAGAKQDTASNAAIRVTVARLLAQGNVKDARRFVMQALSQWDNDEFLYGLKILIDRLLGRNQSEIRREAMTFRQRLPRVSASFAQYAGI